MSLSAETRAQYAAIVDGILATSDLDQVTTKQIRLGLQTAVGRDLTDIKSEINLLIKSRFDHFSGEAEPTDAPEPPSTPARPATNGIKAEPAAAKPQSNGAAHVPAASHASSETGASKRAASSEDSSVVDDAPPKKKPKRPEGESDAELAARLQAEENARSRPTRGGAVRKRAPVKVKTPKKSKKKSSAKVKDEDDSDLDSGSNDDKPVKRNGAFHKPMMLSEPLSVLVGGETQLSRPQTVKKIWEYIRAHDLQNPEDKRQIICDDTMRAVFKQDSVHMFSMNKLLSKQLYPVEAEAAAQ